MQSPDEYIDAEPGTADGLQCIRDVAQRFRAALEQAGPFSLAGLRQFPAGACGDTCRLLAEYMHRSGLGEFAIVTGWRRPQMITHAWLTRDGVIVDITADQFAEVDDAVIVGRTSPWHSTWCAEPPNWDNVGLTYYAEWTGSASDFSRIVAIADR